ncbi:mitochondrial fission ELM1 family protein [Roseovarius autotrophicus]|uniref:mitochondrial fission ELM1 family protein n=1 Tax=Roseovarius autotrophicus TaxID=2824121 RepID=UPI001FFCE122|nr:ELM1/GtrOC1 family putative glycosyltransferase [Roseovarius autotrophicus]
MMQAKVWTLLGRKAGDNTQVETLAAMLGWPVEDRHISARAWELLPHLVLGETLWGIDVAASSPLAPPWPDLVISAGRRNEPVARWIRRQAGGRVKLVHVGRPWAPLDTWDLVVTTPQYFLAQGGNVLVNPLPLHPLSRESVAPEAARLGPRLAHLPRPWTTVLIGGDSGAFVFTPETGRRLAEGVNRLVAATGGGVLVSDSPRTPAPARAAFQAALTVPAECFWFHARQDWPGNPYRGFLGLADRFVVTGESMSMLAEAAAMGRPLYVFDPSEQGQWWWRAHNWRHKPLSHRLAMRLAPVRMRRDVGRIQAALVAQGQARWLEEAPALIAGGEGWFGATAADPLSAARRAAERVRALFGHGPG